MLNIITNLLIVILICVYCENRPANPRGFNSYLIHLIILFEMQGGMSQKGSRGLRIPKLLEYLEKCRGCATCLENRFDNFKNCNSMLSIFNFDNLNIEKAKQNTLKRKNRLS